VKGVTNTIGRVAPRRFSPARIAFFRAVERCAARFGGRAYYRRRYLTPGRLHVRHEDVDVPAGASALDGFRIAALSDFHAGSFLTAEDLTHVLAEVRRADPHVVCLLGDYVVHSIEEARALVPALAQLRAPFGVFAVFGNHDYRGRREHELVAWLAPHGVRFLRNGAVRIRVASGAPGVPDAHLALVGIEDAEEGKVVDVAGARAGVESGDVEVALSHNPRATCRGCGASALRTRGCASSSARRRCS
jgi:predicted MPP superfamily phosphohydrolase